MRSSTAANPKVLRILFYGQSISTTQWTREASEFLRKRYPDTRFVIGNMAIGGFSAELLERTVQRDVTAFYPDLIVFHVYGDHRAYERILRIIRSQTAAEVILQTDHVTSPVEPMCDEGIHFTLRPPPGCRGILYYKQNSWDQEMSGRIIPLYARRYGLALEDRRPLWNAYLVRHQIQPAFLLADSVHPNPQGWRLMARLFDQYFAGAVTAYRGERNRLVDSARPPSASGSRYIFSGNRAELIGSAPINGRIQVLIDGKRPRDLDGCWQVSRATGIPGIPEWPALRQVTVSSSLHRATVWTATVSSVNRVGDDFRFAVTSDTTGAEGHGSADQDFVSRSGDLKIAARDWVIPDAAKYDGVKVANGFTTSWRRGFVCRDVAPVELTPSRTEYRHVLATGLSNGRHVMQIVVNPTLLHSVREVRIYRPPLTSS